MLLVVVLVAGFVLLGLRAQDLDRTARQRLLLFVISVLLVDMVRIVVAGP
jgi:hypothetical protein